MRLSKALMQLFWTAGPVTAVGLTIGYYVGYGKMPPVELMIYFISFTVFSGLTGLIAKIVYDSTRGHIQQQREQDSIIVLDRLCSLLLDVRNLQIEAYDGPERKREAALQLLRRVDLTPYGVQLAFTDLTADRKTGLIMSRLHTYRKAGLFSYVNSLQNRFRPYITAIADRLASDSPDASAVLQQHFTHSKGRNLRQGVDREAFFIQRIFAAIEKEDPYLITLKDVEEFLILCLELLSGREIPVLYFSYRGNWELAEAFDRVERSRISLRVAQARGSNRLYALAAYLRESGISDETNIPKGLPPQNLAEHLYSELQRLSEALIQNQLEGDDLRTSRELLQNSLKLYQMASDGFQSVKQEQEKYLSAVSKWNKLIRKQPNSLQFMLSSFSRKGIAVNQKSLSLTAEEKDELTRHLGWYFRQGGISSLTQAVLGEKEGLTASGNGRSGAGLDYTDKCEAVRRLVIETAVILDPMVMLSRPEVQRNINATKGMYLGELSPDLTASQKQQLCERMAKEVDNNLTSSAEQMARTMANVYHIPLDEDAISFLHLTYGADQNLLKQLAAQAKGSGSPLGSAAIQEESVRLAALSLKPIPAAWKKAAGKTPK